MGSRPWLSIVALGTAVDDVTSFARRCPFDAEVLHVGARPAELAGVVPIAAGPPGRGSGVRRAALAARGRWVLVPDAARTVPLDAHDRLAAAARDRDVDIVVGSRPRESRGLVETALDVLVRLAFRLPVRDSLGGVLLLDRSRIDPLLRRMVVDGSAGTAELLFLAHRYGLEIAEVTVTGGRKRPSSNLAVEAPRVLVDVLRVRWRFRRGAYHPTEPVDKTRGSVQR